MSPNIESYVDSMALSMNATHTIHGHTHTISGKMSECLCTRLQMMIHNLENMHLDVKVNINLPKDSYTVTVSNDVIH